MIAEGYFPPPKFPTAMPQKMKPVEPVVIKQNEESIAQVTADAYQTAALATSICSLFTCMWCLSIPAVILARKTGPNYKVVKNYLIAIILSAIAAVLTAIWVIVVVIVGAPTWLIVIVSALSLFTITFTIAFIFSSAILHRRICCCTYESDNDTKESEKSEKSYPSDSYEYI